jgi:hypothetical protein
LDPEPPKQLRRTLDAIRYLDRRALLASDRLSAGGALGARSSTFATHSALDLNPAPVLF